jgi:hypothetical protein
LESIKLQEALGIMAISDHAVATELGRRLKGIMTHAKVQCKSELGRQSWATLVVAASSDSPTGDSDLKPAVSQGKIAEYLGVAEAVLAAGAVRRQGYLAEGCKVTAKSQTVAVLKEEQRRLGMPMGGNKPELLARLVTHILGQTNLDVAAADIGNG